MPQLANSSVTIFPFKKGSFSKIIVTLLIVFSIRLFPSLVSLKTQSTFSSSAGFMPETSFACSNFSFTTSPDTVLSSLASFDIAWKDGSLFTGVASFDSLSLSENICSLIKSNAFTSCPEHGSVAWWEYKNRSSSYRIAPPVVDPPVYVYLPGISVASYMPGINFSIACVTV